MNERMLDFEKWMTAATDKIDSLSSAIEDLESQMEKMKIDAPAQMQQIEMVNARAERLEKSAEQTATMLGKLEKAVVAADEESYMNP